MCTIAICVCARGDLRSRAKDGSRVHRQCTCARWIVCVSTRHGMLLARREFVGVGGGVSAQEGSVRGH